MKGWNPFGKVDMKTGSFIKSSVLTMNMLVIINKARIALRLIKPITIDK